MEAEEKEFDLSSVAIVDGVALLLMLAFSAYAWTRIPDGAWLPTHWGANGEVDGYGSKGFALFIMPAAGAIIAALNLVLPSIDPRRKHLARSQRGYTAIWCVLMAWMAIIHCALISIYLGSNLRMAQIMPVLIGILFVVIGNFMGKIRSNFFMGVRTPWTLSSEESWNRTNRLGGLLFMAIGVIAAIAGLIDGKFFAVALMATLPLSTLVLVVYSYIVWKNDPLKKSST
ncbi:SdpI family protein [soil metagenome]